MRASSHPSAAKRDDALTQPSPPSQSGNNANRSLSGSLIVSKALAASSKSRKGMKIVKKVGRVVVARRVKQAGAKVRKGAMKASALAKSKKAMK